jgi:hypothetical protein
VHATRSPGCTCSRRGQLWVTGDRPELCIGDSWIGMGSVCVRVHCAAPVLTVNGSLLATIPLPPVDNCTTFFLAAEFLALHGTVPNNCSAL